MTDISLKDIMSFFGMTSAEFAREWKQLSPESKGQIKIGLSNGTLDYVTLLDQEV